MSIVFGTGLYGLVDNIPGTCYVRTQFAHFMFFPFIPMRTFLVVKGERGQSDTAHPIAKSLKSVRFAMARALLMFVFMVAVGIPLDRLMDSRPGARRTLETSHKFFGAIGFGCLGLVLASYPLSRPNESRRGTYSAWLRSPANRTPRSSFLHRSSRRRKKPSGPGSGGRLTPNQTPGPSI